MTDTSMLVIFAGVMIAMGCGGLLLQALFAGPARRMRKRAQAVERRWHHGGQPPVPGLAGGNASLRRTEKKSLPGLDKLIRRVLPNQQVLRARLARTGRDIPVATYVASCVVVAVAMGTLAGFVFGAPPVIATLVGMGGGAGIPHFMIGRMAAGRLKKFGAIFPDAIDLMVRGLKSGLPVSESINAVGTEMADPVGIEFRRIADAVRFGQPMDAAMLDAAQRLGAAEFKFFVISLAVQRETGGNLGETLANLSDILRRRRQMRLKIKAMSSEARASAMILGSLPFVMLCLLMLINFDYEMTLFTDPRGRMMVGAGVGIMTIGIAVMAKMVRFEI